MSDLEKETNSHSVQGSLVDRKAMSFDLGHTWVPVPLGSCGLRQLVEILYALLFSSLKWGQYLPCRIEIKSFNSYVTFPKTSQ